MSESRDIPTMEKIPFKKTVKDVISLELTRPVLSRVKKRLKELKELGSAHHEKETRGHKIIWHTTRPKIHMSTPEAKIENNIGVISYTVYKSDENGDKKIEVTKGPDPRNPEKEIDVQAVYVEEGTIIETIQRYKPLKKERI